MRTKTNDTEPSFDRFKKSCSNNQDFDLLCSIHLSENDHTRILRDILNQKIQGERIFLKSFFDKVLNRECNNEQDYQCKDQITAKGNQDNSKGFVDLFIYSKELNIIIENKVCGASDTKDQLIRYCLSYCSNKQITGIGLKLENKDCNNSGSIPAYIYYLTCDGQKEPSTTSIDGKTLGALKNKELYFPINYEKDILPWLENDVLPNIPYKSDGNMIKGILLYINYLNTLVGHGSNNDSSIWRDCTISDLYDALKNDTSSQTGEDTDEDNVLYRKYINSLKLAIENKLNQIVSGINNEWSVHFAPSFIQLYKTSWSEYFKNRICPIHFELLNYENAPHWVFHIESAEYKKDELRNDIQTILSKSNINELIQKLNFDDETLRTYLQKVITILSERNLCDTIEKCLSQQNQNAPTLVSKENL